MPLRHLLQRDEQAFGIKRPASANAPVVKAEDMRFVFRARQYLVEIPTCGVHAMPPWRSRCQSAGTGSATAAAPRPALNRAADCYAAGYKNEGAAFGVIEPRRLEYLLFAQSSRLLRPPCRPKNGDLANACNSRRKRLGTRRLPGWLVAYGRHNVPCSVSSTPPLARSPLPSTMWRCAAG